MSLKFSTLRAANQARLPRFRNKKGELAHPTPDGSDWCLAQWSNASLGELGEAANLIKKLERGDFGLDDVIDDGHGNLVTAREALGKELADVVIYLDILAFRAGVDLGSSTIEKFNEVSDRVGAGVHISSDGDGVLDFVSMREAYSK